MYIGQFLFAYLVVYLYIDWAGRWVVFGNGLLKFNPTVLWFEIPFAAITSSLFFFPSIKNFLVRHLLPLLPVIIFYTLFDIFYNHYFRTPRTSEWVNFVSLFDFSPKLGIGLLLIGLIIPAVLLTNILILKKQLAKPEFTKMLLTCGLIFVGYFTVVTTNYFAEFQNQFYRYVVWSQEDTIRESGRLNSFVYFYHDENRNLERFKQLKNDDEFAQLDIHAELYQGEIAKSKNIHMIVLESFIDPRLFEGVSYNRSPLAEELLPYFSTINDFSHPISPIYGGGTPQAEFELLVGLKALEKIDKIEFNVMRGGQVSSLLKKLNAEGYHSMATISTGMEYFNSPDAYDSLGFEQVDFLTSIDKFKQDYKDGFIFDGDVLDYNFDQVSESINAGQPVFNYVLGMYGHHPFERDKENRPDVIKIQQGSIELERIANQFYYRTKAIASYISKIKEIDPDSIIYVTSDHLPPILGDKVNYKVDPKTNIALLIDRTHAIDVTGKRFYQIPWLIWDRLIGKPTRREISESKMELLILQSLTRKPKQF